MTSQVFLDACEAAPWRPMSMSMFRARNCRSWAVSWPSSKRTAEGKRLSFFLHFNVNNNLGPPSSVQVGRMVTWRLAKPPGNHVTPWWLKAKDPISRRTVTFGETRRKKVHASPHMWVAAATSWPIVCGLFRKQLIAIQFLHADKTRILRVF